jgi:hypothetical protein
MSITHAHATIAGWPVGAIAVAAGLAFGPVLVADTITDSPAMNAVPITTHYGAATELARQQQAMLLVSVEPAGGDPTDAAGQWLERADVQERFAASGTPWVFCRIGIDDPSATDGPQPRLIDHPSLAELRHGPGIFVVDHAHDEEGLAGRIVSILPRRPGKYYRFDPAHIDELASLPAGTLTQRSLILAVRIHPERPHSVQGVRDPVLAREAAAHSEHQARIRRQGHHDWQTRSQRIHGLVPGGYPTEVCAESWEDQDLLDSCVDCVASWRQSSGHWNAVKSPQAAYGYDIRRGANGIWYATGIFTP